MLYHFPVVVVVVRADGEAALVITNNSGSRLATGLGEDHQQGQNWE
jgi:hypothetical protein